MACRRPQAAALRGVFAKWVYVLPVLRGSLALHGNRLYTSSLAFDLSNGILKYKCGVLRGGVGWGW